MVGALGTVYGVLFGFIGPLFEQLQAKDKWLQGCGRSCLVYDSSVPAWAHAYAIRKNVSETSWVHSLRGQHSPLHDLR